MDNRNQNNGGMTFFHGLLLGGIVGLLFAPKRGEEMRRELKSRIDQVANGVNQGGQEVRENLENVRDNIVQGVQDVTENISNKAEEVKREAENKVNEKKEEARQAIETKEKEMNTSNNNQKGNNRNNQR